MTSTSPSSSSARPRNPVLVVADVVVGVILILIGIVFGLVIIATATSYGGLHAECGTGPYEGLVCNSAALATVVYGLIGVTVIAWFLGLGFFVVSLLRKRYGFWWPLGALAITIVLFYVGTWVAGMTLP